jgi:hypothetical protein
LRASATIRRFVRARRFAGIRRSQPLRQHTGHYQPRRNAAISETHVFSPHTVNQLNVGYNRIFDFITSYGTGSCEAQKLGIPGANLGGISCGLTSTQMTGYWSLGDRGYAPFQGGTNVFSVSDSLDMIRGSTTSRLGGSIRANQMNVKTNGFPGWILDLFG